MPSSVFVNDQLGLRISQHTGSVSRAEFDNLVGMYHANPRVFLYDVVHILDDAASFDFGAEELPALKGDLRNLINAAKLPLILRSAWVCASPSAWAMLEDWLHERHSLDGLHTEALLVATLDETAGVFDADEIHAVRNMTGFRPYFST